MGFDPESQPAVASPMFRQFFASQQRPPAVERTDKLGAPFWLREAVERDADLLVELKRRILAETDYLLQGLADFDADPAAERDVIRRFQDSSDSRLVIAERLVAGHRAAIGLVTIVAGAFQRNRHVGQLGMGVVRSEWGRGVGAALLDDALCWGGDHATLRKISLQVYASNARAIGLYAGRGFTEEGRLREEARRDDDRFDDLIVMGRFVVRDP